MKAPRMCASRRLFRVTSAAPICRQCRAIATTSALSAGHNKWSKIKHEKGAADLRKTAFRMQISKNITDLCKFFGETSPQLANAVAAAKKAGVPKANIDAAIARGLGRSTTGAALEPMTFEAMLPPSVALVIEAETDSRARSLQDVHTVLKRHGAAVSASKFCFSRAGRVVFAPSAKDVEEGASLMDRIMDDAIEAGAEDLDMDEDGNVVVWTPPSGVSQVARDVSAKFGLDTLTTEILWSPNEDTMATFATPEEATKLAALLGALRELSEVQAIYCNVSQGSLSDEVWAEVEENLDS